MAELYPDIIYWPPAIIAYQAAGKLVIRCAYPTIPLWSGNLPAGSQARPSLTVHDGRLSVGWHDALGSYVWTPEVEEPVRLGPGTGGRSVLLGYGWAVWMEPDPEGKGNRQVFGKPLGDLNVAPLLLRYTQASNGLSYLKPGPLPGDPPSVVDFDENRRSVPWGFNPHRAGDMWTVAEAKDSGVEVRHPKGRLRLWPGEVTFEPRCALDPAGKLGVATFGGGLGVRFKEVREADLLPLVEPEPQPPPPIPHFEPINRPGFLIGYFKAYSDRYGDWPEAPGNVIVGDDEETAITRAAAAGRNVIVDYSFGDTRDWKYEKQVKAVYVADEESLDRLEKKVERVRTEWSGPIITYSGRNGWIVEGPNIYHGIEGYLLKPEATPAETAQALRTQLGQALSRYKPEHKIALIAQAYDRNGTWKNAGPHLAAMQPVYYEVAKADPRVMAILWFSA